MSSPLSDSLQIHIVGAGMGGMGSALALARRGFKHIHVWESAPALGEVGAGINVPPNMARLLDLWGVLGIAEAEAVTITTANVLDESTEIYSVGSANWDLHCASDTVLTSVDYSAYMKETYGYPFLTVHRAALQKSLVQGALNSGVVRLHLNQFITEYDFDKTRLKVKQNDASEPQWIDADVILGADGVKSKARAAMMARNGEIDEVEDTGQAAYRIMVRRAAIKDDPELVPFFTGTQSYRWIGEKRHIIAYPIESGDLLNMSTTQPDRNFVQADTWTASGSKSEMLATFHDFCPRVQKLLNLVPEGDVLEWKLRIHSPLPSWVDGDAALVGDACHPTLPHIAQGAAQAIEDAAALAVVLSKIKTKADIHKALLVYQKIRKPRTDWAVLTASANSKGLLTADKATRDSQFEAVAENAMTNPDKMISRETHDILFHYDIVKETEENFERLFAEV